MIIKNVTVQIHNKEECEEDKSMNDMNFNNQKLWYNIFETVETVLGRVYKKISNKNIEKNDYRIKEGLAFVLNDGSIVFAKMSFNFYKFMKKHYDNLDLISIEFIIGIPGGNGAEIRNLCKIKMYGNEPHHKGYSHVHIYRCDGKKERESITISLNDLQIKKNDKSMELFSKKEINKILQIISENKNVLVETYKKMTNGENIESFLLEDSKGDYDNIIFKV